MKSIFEETIQNLRRNISLSVSSFIIIQIILFIVAVSVAFTIISYSTLSSLKSNTQIHVQLEDKINGETLETIINNINKKYEVSVTYQTKEEELDTMIRYYGDSGEFLNIYKDNNPLKNALLIQCKDASQIQEIAKYIKNMDGVYHINYGGNEVVKLTTLLENVKTFAIILIIILTLLIFLILFNTVKLSILSRKDELFIKQSIGASPKMIQAPFIIESVLFHIISMIIPCCLCSFLYYYIYSNYNDIQIFRIAIISPLKMNLYLFGGMFIFVTVVGFLSSYYSTNRIIRKFM